MAALSGGEMCIKYLMFAFNLVFWVSLERRELKWGREWGVCNHPVCVLGCGCVGVCVSSRERSARMRVCELFEQVTIVN